MAFSHILLTRPRSEGEELAGLLDGHATDVLSLPAYSFHGCDPFPDTVQTLGESAARGDEPLVIFTSPRAVEHGLQRVPAERLGGCRVAAIGPTTGRLLTEAAVTVSLQARQGHTSEDLLAELPACDRPAGEGRCEAFILTAPGGRTALADGLRKAGYRPHLVLVYERKPAELDHAVIERLGAADDVLSVWTSADTIRSLSQRLPAETWKRLCAGEWIVISERLARVARSFHPRRVHIADGPTNADLAAAIHALQ